MCIECVLCAAGAQLLDVGSTDVWRTSFHVKTKGVAERLPDEAAAKSGSLLGGNHLLYRQISGRTTQAFLACSRPASTATSRCTTHMPLVPILQNTMVAQSLANHAKQSVTGTMLGPACEQINRAGG